jgi:uncharacterized protein YxeA
MNTKRTTFIIVALVAAIALSVSMVTTTNNLAYANITSQTTNDGTQTQHSQQSQSQVRDSFAGSHDVCVNGDCEQSTTQFRDIFTVT